MNEANAASEKSLSPIEGGELERRLLSVDLNLLVALDALLLCRNVTYAARRLGQTQPAMSRMLGRLRDLLGDDLLVRGSSGLRLTTRAEYLCSLVPLAMSQARGIIGTTSVPSGIRVSINANLMPALLPHFVRNPGIGRGLRINSHRVCDDGVMQLRSRLVDLVVGTISEKHPDIASHTICTEEFITLVAFEFHRLGGARPGTKAFLALSHINLIEEGREVFPQVAETLSAHGVQRSTLCDVPDVASAALMVSQGTLALTVPRSIAGWLTRTLKLSVLTPPIAIPCQEIVLSWRVSDHDAVQGPVIQDIVAATREAIALDHAAIQALRCVEREGRS